MQQLEFRVRDAARARRVDRRHHGRVEHVDVDVHPEAEAVGKLIARPGRRTTGAFGPQLRDGSHGDPGRLQVEPVVVLRAYAEQHDVGVPHVRPQAVDVGQVGLAAAGGEREILAGGRTNVGRVARVPEVGVAVDIHQAVRQLLGDRPPAHGESRSDQDRAVAAEDDRKLAGIDDRTDPVGQPDRVVGDLGRMADAVARPPVTGVVPWRRQAAGVAGVQASEQTLVTQRAGRLGTTRHGRRSGWTQAEVGRCVEDSDPAHRRRPSEQRAGQGAARRDHRRIVGAGHREQRDQM